MELLKIKWQHSRTLQLTGCRTACLPLALVLFLTARKQCSYHGSSTYHRTQIKGLVWLQPSIICLKKDVACKHIWICHGQAAARVTVWLKLAAWGMKVVGPSSVSTVMKAQATTSCSQAVDFGCLGKKYLPGPSCFPGSNQIPLRQIKGTKFYRQNWLRAASKQTLSLLPMQMKTWFGLSHCCRSLVLIVDRKQLSCLLFIKYTYTAQSQVSQRSAMQAHQSSSNNRKSSMRSIHPFTHIRMTASHLAGLQASLYLYKYRTGTDTHTPSLSSATASDA